MSSAAGEAEEARALQQSGVDLRRRQALVVLQPEQQPGVDGPGPGRHDQPLERGEAHRRVDTEPTPDGGEGCTRPEMARHDPQSAAF